jgi:large subunit ribosomal protein L10
MYLYVENVEINCNVHFLFAAGIVHERLLSRNELEQFSQLPDIDVARSQLCAVLQSAGSSIVSQLNQSQQLLVSHLEKHVEINSDSNKNTESS